MNFEKVIAKNKSEFAAKKRELIEAGYKFYDRPLLNYGDFVKTEGFKSSTITVIRGWKRN